MTLSFYGKRDAPVLFGEDFDPPSQPRAPVSQRAPEPPEPEVIEPVFSAAELTAARDEAWHLGYEQARGEATAAGETASNQALAALAAQVTQVGSEARAIAEHAAEAIALLVLASFAAAFPALSRRHGPAEVQAVIRTLMPTLQNEAKVTIRVAPASVDTVMQIVERLDLDAVPQVRVLPVETMAPGDVRVAWCAGDAVRDTARLWQEIEAILAPAGLLPSDAAEQRTDLSRDPAAWMAARRISVKETANVD